MCKESHLRDFDRGMVENNGQTVQAEEGFDNQISTPYNRGE